MNRPGENKPPLHLLPDVLELVATVQGDGAEKHGEFGWRELDLPPVEWVNSADRHMLEFKRGGRADHESGHHPLAHAIADLMIALEKDLQRKVQVGVDFAGAEPHMIVIDEVHTWPLNPFRAPRWWQLRRRRQYRKAAENFAHWTTAGNPEADKGWRRIFK